MRNQVDRLQKCTFVILGPSGVDFPRCTRSAAETVIAVQQNSTHHPNLLSASKEADLAIFSV